MTFNGHEDFFITAVGKGSEGAAAYIKIDVNLIFSTSTSDMDPTTSTSDMDPTTLTIIIGSLLVVIFIIVGVFFWWIKYKRGETLKDQNIYSFGDKNGME